MRRESVATPEELAAVEARIRRGGLDRHGDKLAEWGKLFVRDRLRLLLDEDSFVEEWLLARCLEDELAADGVVTGFGRIGGRTVAVMANDFTVKAGSWGTKTVAKIVKIQERAELHRVPLLYLVDSAGGRIDEWPTVWPGERHAGRIFYNQVRLSGQIPQICILFGPSPAGSAYLPAFCDVVIMVEGKASMYLASPRITEMVIGERVSLEDLGGARMHCTVSGCGDILVRSDEEAIEVARRYLSYFPQHWEERPPTAPARPPRPVPDGDVDALVPQDQNRPFDMYRLIDAIVDEGSFFEIKPLWARELITGLARLDGKPVGILANQPMVKGGVLFVDSSDKGARFIQLCDAFNIPLLFLADLAGFMCGSQVERQGIIRHGAKMISAVSEATVPKVCVVVRKAYGAGLYAMAGPGFEPDAVLALPQAQIAILGPEAAINAIYYNKIQRLPEGEREAWVQEMREAYRREIDVFHMASEMIYDAVVPASRLREELIRRYAVYEGKQKVFARRKHGVTPV
ncbi:MAG: acyl-CoA carboxylase subunit beta [Clostridia bacterium]|nr:acyl-CoA carboxylase subunit beta [Clostridia bacterium]